MGMGDRSPFFFCALTDWEQQQPAMRRSRFSGRRLPVGQQEMKWKSRSPPCQVSVSWPLRVSGVLRNGWPSFTEGRRASPSKNGERGSGKKTQMRARKDRVLRSPLPGGMGGQKTGKGPQGERNAKCVKGVFNYFFH